MFLVFPIPETVHAKTLQEKINLPVGASVLQFCSFSDFAKFTVLFKHLSYRIGHYGVDPLIPIQNLSQSVLFVKAI
jgi:hypothetical protein